MVWGFDGDLGGKDNTASQGWGLGDLLADANDGGRKETFANNVLEFVKAGQSPGAESTVGGDAGTRAEKVFSDASGTQSPGGWTGDWSPLQRLQSSEVSRVKSFVDAGKVVNYAAQGEANGQADTANNGGAQRQHEAQTGDSNGTTHSGKLSWGKHMWHYFVGEGTPIVANIEDVYHGEPVVFNDKNRAGFDTHGPVGRIVLERLENGDIVAKPDVFDFDKQEWGVRDPDGFPYPKEVSTRIGALLPGTPFETRFEGNISDKKGDE